MQIALIKFIICSANLPIKFPSISRTKCRNKDVQFVVPIATRISIFSTASFKTFSEKQLNE